MHVIGKCVCIAYFILIDIYHIAADSFSDQTNAVCQELLLLCWGSRTWLHYSEGTE